jgi:hypothetical protein
MSSLLERAIAKVKLLPETEQDAIASIVLQEIESEERWKNLFDDPRSDAVLSRLADQAIESTNKRLLDCMLTGEKDSKEIE